MLDMKNNLGYTPLLLSVYNSEFEITIHDNLTEVTNIKDNTYTKTVRTDTDGKGSRLHEAG